MATNSQGLEVSQAHLTRKMREEAYLKDMQELLEKRGDRKWDEELRNEYNRILVRHGVLSLESLPEQLRPEKK
jgi:hypothetical protein